MFAHATDCYRPTQLRTACTTNSPDKHAAHWRERQRAQTILWLSEGKTVAEVAALQERIPETIRQRRHWELHQFESIQEGHRSGRPNTLTSNYQAQILEWVNTSPLNAEQIRVKLHEKHGVSVSVETLRKFLRDSGMVFKRTRHSLKKETRPHLDKRNSRLKHYVSKRRGEIVLGYVDETGFWLRQIIVVHGQR
jgi:transposase